MSTSKTKGRKRRWIGAFLLVALLIGSGISYFLLPTRIQHLRVWRASEELIGKVDDFARLHRRLPVPEQIGVSEFSQIFYDPQQEYYRVGFYLGFDDYCVFDSRDRKWTCTK